jgi:hypothetical protein
MQINKNNNRKDNMSRIRLNQEYRNKIGNRMQVHLQQEPTVEKQKYDDLKADQIDINDKAWKVAEKIVRRHYTPSDVDKAYYLQNKFENVNTIAKDSCFHFHYLGKKETRDYDNNLQIEENVPIEKHFDFRLNGSIDTENNSSHSRSDNEYGYALFRDELKAQDNCNPDILIEQEGKENNPHKTKYTDANNKYLGDDDKGYGKEWNEKYQLDLIGREYCRDRTLLCSEQEFMMLQDWKVAKGQFVIAHQKWIGSILEQMNKVVKPCLKGWKYLDEAIEFSKKAGLDISDAEIIRTNSTGLALYNPENAVQMLNSMKNKKVKTKAEKIAERVLYDQQSQVAN